jgi:preprotein translocase subunit SecG
MELVILVIHVFLAIAIIGVILLQPPESSSLGGLGGSNPMAGVGSRGQGNLLTRITGILATCFICTSLILAVMSGHKPHNTSILDEAESSPAMNTPKDKAPVAAPDKAPTAATPVAPSVPLSK